MKRKKAQSGGYAEHLEIGSSITFRRKYMDKAIQEAVQVTALKVMNLFDNEESWPEEIRAKFVNLYFTYGDWILRDEDIKAAAYDPAVELLIKAKLALRQG